MPAQTLAWDDLRFILAIGKEGSLSGAARRLAVNHATVFRRLKAMEEAIGVRLFERQPEGYVATAAGAEAIEIAEELEEKVATLERRIVGRDCKPSGTVRITTVESILLEVFPAMVDRFRAKHPEIELELISSTAQLNLSRRDADVAVRATPSPPELLVGRRLATIASAAYAPAAFAPPSDLGDLGRLPWIGYDESLAHLKAARWLTRFLGEKPPAIRVNNVLAVKTMVEAGVGVGFMPCFMGDTGTSITRVIDPDPQWNSDLWILTHPDLRQVPRVRAVMDHFAEELAALRPLFEGDRAKAGAKPALKASGDGVLALPVVGAAAAE
jgi:DNA-binding transcriptional LysR family regulator